MQSTLHVYEIRPRKDKRGVDLISDALPFGRLTTDFRLVPPPGLRRIAPRYAQFAAQIRNTLEGKLGGFPPDSFKSLGSESGGFFLQIFPQPAAAGLLRSSPASSAIPARLTAPGAV